MPKDRFDHRNMNGYGVDSPSRIPGRPKRNLHMEAMLRAKASNDEASRLPYETVLEVARLWYLGDSSMTMALVAAQLSLGCGCVRMMVTGQSYHHEWLRAVSEIILEGHQCVQPRVRARAEKASGLVQ